VFNTTVQLSGLVQKAEQCEFKDREYNTALRVYQQLFDKANNPQLEARALQSIARVYQKLNLPTKAIKLYHQLQHSYNHTKLVSGHPAGLIAQLELGSLYLSTTDTLRALQEYVDLYKKLSHSTWCLQKSQFDFYIQKITHNLDACLGTEKFNQYASVYDSIKTLHKKLRKRTERLITFQQTSFQYIENFFSIPKDSFVVKNFSVEIDDQLFLVSIMPSPVLKDNHTTMLGILFDPEHLKSSWFPPVITKQLSARKIGWQITDRYGNIVLGESKAPTGKPSVKTGFAYNIPPWTLELFAPESTLVTMLLFSQHRIYFYVFILIAVILAFGLYMTIHSLSHELELATLKSNFVSAISHDLKTPVTAVRQLAEMLQAGRVPSIKRRQQYHNALVEQSERLSFMIDNILDSARIETGRIEYFFEKIDLREALKDIVAKIQHHVQQNGFKIKTQLPEESVYVLADSTALQQSIVNLIDNALKFSVKNKVIDVRLEKGAEHVIIVIEDYCVGIPKEEMNRIFERFYQGSSVRNHRRRGSGLGLFLVKQIVAAHHGTVQVKSKLGKGSVFSIKLPIYTK